MRVAGRSVRGTEKSKNLWTLSERERKRGGERQWIIQNREREERRVRGRETEEGEGDKREGERRIRSREGDWRREGEADKREGEKEQKENRKIKI